MAEFIRRKILFDYFWLTEHLQRKCDKTHTLAVSVMGTQKSGARLLTGQNCHILILNYFGYLESFQACLGFIFFNKLLYFCLFQYFCWRFSGVRE